MADTGRAFWSRARQGQPAVGVLLKIRALGPALNCSASARAASSLCALSLKCDMPARDAAAAAAAADSDRAASALWPARAIGLSAS